MKDIIPQGIIDDSKPHYFSARNFTDRRGYWNYRGGIILCFITGHRWKWTKGTFYNDGCAPWHVQCTRCLKVQEPPHEH